MYRTHWLPRGASAPPLLVWTRLQGHQTPARSAPAAARRCQTPAPNHLLARTSNPVFASLRALLFCVCAVLRLRPSLPRTSFLSQPECSILSRPGKAQNQTRSTRANHPHDFQHCCIVMIRMPAHCAAGHIDQCPLCGNKTCSGSVSPCSAPAGRPDEFMHCCTTATHATATCPFLASPGPPELRL